MLSVNWATGLPGVQPKWEGEYSIFVGDLGREVTEGELVALFTPLFQSTKSAKIMYDPSTGLSRGYGFVRFGDENDMTRSLALGQNSSGSGLSLRGRTLRISEASGSGGSRARTQSSEGEAAGTNPARSARDLHIKVPHTGMCTTLSLFGYCLILRIITLCRHSISFKSSRAKRDWFQHPRCFPNIAAYQLTTLLEPQSWF